MRAQFTIAALGFTIAVAYCQSDADLIQKYEQQLRENPRSSRAHYELGEVYFRQQNYQTAANEYRQALNGDLDPPLIETLAHLGLAHVFDQTGQPDRATNERTQAARSAADPPKPPEPKPIQPSRPTAIQKATPEYPEEARAAGLEGIVFVTVNVAADGTSADASVPSPLGLGLDEQAVAVARQWRFTPFTPSPSPVSVPIYFLLPEKLSRWHLVGAAFQPPEGASRPVFLTEPYPLGAGISDKAIDEGAVISAIRRDATVKLQFDVNERGVPTKFQVLAASDNLWGDEAITVVRRWRFKPGAKDGKPVPVPCALDLVWGQKVWTSESLAKLAGNLATLTPAPLQPAPVPVLIPPADPLALATSPAGAPPKIAAAYFIIDWQRPRNQICVILSAAIDKDGIPRNVQVVRSLGYAYDSVAIDAIRSWRLNPTLLNGQPVSMTRLIEVDFAPGQ